jgi:hypothetical protein
MISPKGRKNARRSTTLHSDSSSSHKCRVGLAPARDPFPRAKPLVGGLFKYFPQNCSEDANQFHPRSSTSRVATNGVSVESEA